VAPIPFVDAHHHLWDLSVRAQEWTDDQPVLHRTFGVDDIRPLLGENEVNATVLVQTLNVADETRELLALASANDFIAGVVGWVDLLDADVDDQLRQLQDRSGSRFLVGIRHLVQDEEDPTWLARPRVLEGLRHVERAGLAYDLLVRPGQIDSAVSTVRALPNLKFVLDHFGKPSIVDGDIDSWKKQMKAMAGCENVAVKFSGLVTEADHHRWSVDDLRPYVDVIFYEFGPERVMFGSDWPVCLLAATYGDVVRVARELTSDLSADETDSVFGGTAIQWYGLAIS
jgi:L-fuconolactonase